MQKTVTTFIPQEIDVRTYTLHKSPRIVYQAGAFSLFVGSGIALSLTTPGGRYNRKDADKYSRKLGTSPFPRPPTWYLVLHGEASKNASKQASKQNNLEKQPVGISLILGASDRLCGP
eukprot:2138941-Amphidinium_carterae.1